MASTGGQRFRVLLRGYGSVAVGALFYALFLPGRRMQSNWLTESAPGPRLVRYAGPTAMLVFLVIQAPMRGVPHSMGQLPHRLSLLFPVALAIGVALAVARRQGSRDRRDLGRAGLDVAVVVAGLLFAYRLTLFEGRDPARLAALAALPAMSVSLMIVALQMVGRVRRLLLPFGLLAVFWCGRAVVPPLWNSVGRGGGLAAAAVTWSVHAVPWAVFLLLAATRRRDDSAGLPPRQVPA